MAEITMRISDRALRVAGIFLGGISLVFLFLFLWSTDLFVPKYRLRLYVPEVAGLGERASVRLDGIEIGTVHSIRLAEASASPDRRIQLVLQVERRYREAIRSGSTATLATEGLLGNRYVSIRRGFTGGVIDPDGEIPGVPTQVTTMKDILNSMAKKLDCTEPEKDSAGNKAQGSQEIPSKPRH